MCVCGGVGGGGGFRNVGFGLIFSPPHILDLNVF